MVKPIVTIYLFLTLRSAVKPVVTIYLFLTLRSAVKPFVTIYLFLTLRSAVKPIITIYLFLTLRSVVLFFKKKQNYFRIILVQYIVYGKHAQHRGSEEPLKTFVMLIYI